MEAIGFSFEYVYIANSLISKSPFTPIITAINVQKEHCYLPSISMPVSARKFLTALWAHRRAPKFRSAHPNNVDSLSSTMSDSESLPTSLSS